MTRPTALSSAATLFVVCAMSLAPGAHAVSQRTFVGTAGTDNPNCTLAAPCRTFTAAIAAALDGGEVIVLASGGYGPVTITKSVSIVASPGVYAGISVGSGDGVTINGAGITVVLRGLSINGVGGTNGVTIDNAATVNVDGCSISNMNGPGILHRAGELFVQDSLIRNNLAIGIWSLGAVEAHVDRVRMEQNLDGIRAQDGATAVVNESVMARNAHVGAFVFVDDNSPFTFLTVSRSLMSRNQQGGQARSITGPTAQAILRVTDSTVTDNTDDGLLTTQLNGGAAAIFARRNTIANSGTGADLHVTVGTFAQVDDNYMPGLLVDSGATIGTRHNNTVDSSGVFGTVLSTGSF